MKHAFLASLAVASLVAAAPLAAHPIDGTWKTDPKKIEFSKRPDVHIIADGTYRCESCTPPWSVPADGKLHATPGRPYADEASVTVVDASTVRMTQRHRGKQIGEALVRVAADGNTLTYDWTDTGAASGRVEKGRETMTRVSAAPAGAHATSGGWLTTAVESATAGAFEQTFRVEGDTVHLSTPTGESYVAKLGGPAVPIVGDRAGTMASVRSTGPATLVETGTRAGKPIYEMTFTVAPDGRSMTVANVNKQTGATSSFVATRQ